MNRPAVSVLFSSKQRILNTLREVIRKRQFNYRTFGTDIESFVSDELILIFKEAGFIRSPRDYHTAKDKNEFPDFTLYVNPHLAIEIKSGNHRKLSFGNWVNCSNSNNDMGTLNKWPEKLKKFGTKNIFYIFIEYSFDDEQKSIIDVKIDNFYKFLGSNRDGLLKYREKDGNLRPKDFSAPSLIQSARQFEELISTTIVYRSKRIVKKHLENIPQKEREILLNDWKPKKND